MSNNQDLVEMHAIFSGRVQGVGFRFTTQYFAIDLKLKGTVRNVPDGTVEIYAQGTKKNLDELIERLKAQFTRVEVVTLEYSHPLKSLTAFTILP